LLKNKGIRGDATYDEAELVKAVDDVQQRSLATLVQVRRLEQRRRRHSVRLGCIVEVLDVAQRHKTARRFRVERCRRQTCSLRQLVDQPTTAVHHLEAFLRKSAKLGYRAKRSTTVASICDDAGDCKLFTRITGNTQHLLYPLLPLNANITKAVFTLRTTSYDSAGCLDARCRTTSDDSATPDNVVRCRTTSVRHRATLTQKLNQVQFLRQFRCDVVRRRAVCEHRR